VKGTFRSFAYHLSLTNLADILCGKTINSEDGKTIVGGRQEGCWPNRLHRRAIVVSTGQIAC